jgi:hypothetical protein
VEPLNEQCREDDRMACAESFEKAAIDWRPTETEALALQRYRTLLAYRAWRDVTFDVYAPIPPFGDVIHAQRLYQLSMLQLAMQGNIDAVREGLSEEIAYWRGAQRNAETLIAKMISLAALRNHFFYSSLVLRRLPADQILRAVPPEWLREFSDDERSMHLVVAGEWKWNDELFREGLDGGFLFGLVEPTFFERSLFNLGRPFFKPQDTLNALAERHMRFADQFAVPMIRYVSAKQTLEAHDRDHPHPISIYNPMGDWVLSQSGSSDYSGYAFRAANPEGMRRAALLVVQLRSRGIAAGHAGSEVAHAAMRDPYTDAPFEWDAKRASVIFNAPEEGTRGRHEYIY